MKLKVVSYNICHGLGIDGRWDFMRTIEVLRQREADLIGLQEVDRHFGARSDWDDQPARLAEALGMHVAYGVNLDLDPPPERPGSRRQYGTAILSRYPIVSSRNHRLPQVNVPGAWKETRGALEAVVQIEGEQVRIFNTHLGLSQEERVVQVRALLEAMRPEEGRCIVTGDFNAEPGVPELQAMTRELCDVFAEAHGGRHDETFLGTDGNGGVQAIKCIDYIFCSRDFRVNGAEAVMTPASDHLPLETILAW